MNETTQAASSPADVFNGEQVSLAEFSKYREDGTIPERFKPADPAESAPADESKETEQSDIDPDSDPDEAQEQPHKDSPAETPADKRIKQLLAERYQLRRKLEEVTKQDARPDSSPAKPTQPPAPPQNYQEYRQAFKPSAFIEEYGKQNPDATYEDANAAMADHLFEVRKHFDVIESRVNAAKQALDSKVSEAKERYEDFDDIKQLVISKFVSDKNTPLIPPNVYEVIDTSDVIVDLLYTLGSDESELDKFVKMAQTNPTKAIRYVAKLENLIAEELAKPKEAPARGEDGKFKSSAPEKPKTQAPKPPSPVGGGSSRAFDVSDDSLSPEEWMRQRNAQLARKA